MPKIARVPKSQRLTFEDSKATARPILCDPSNRSLHDLEVEQQQVRFKGHEGA